MKVLFVMETPEYLRFFDTTFSHLLEHGHSLVLAVTEDKQKKPVRLDHFGEGHPSLTIAGVAPAHRGYWGEIAKGLRGTVDFVRFLHPDYRNAPALRNRMRRKVLPVAFQPLGRLTSGPEWAVRAALGLLAACESAVPVSPDIREFIAAHRPDVVFVSPLVDAASAEVDVIKAARSLGIPAGVCVASWDNLTNKGLLRTPVDRVVVWNEQQRAEAVRYHRVPAEAVVATGAQPFDRWFDRRPSTTRETFCRTVGLPADRPFLVFTGSSGFISEGQLEVAFVRRWIAALRAAPDARVAQMGIMIRPHPYNFAAWEGQDLSGTGPTVMWPRERYNPLAEESRAVFYDSLYHSMGVFGVNTSAMVEAAIIGRPVFSMRAEEFAETQEGTLHFHYLLVENGGCIKLAASMADHLDQIARELASPGSLEIQARQFVETFIRPHGLDRPATPILAEAIVGLAGAPRPVAARASWWVFPLRGLILAVSMVTGMIARLASPRWRGRVRRSVQRQGERIRKQVHRRGFRLRR